MKKFGKYILEKKGNGLFFNLKHVSLNSDENWPSYKRYVNRYRNLIVTVNTFIVIVTVNTIIVIVNVNAIIVIVK